MEPSEFLLVEKYRPKTLSDCILPPAVEKIFRGFINRGELPNMLLSGPPGIGKTTIAKALCNELGVEFMFINASEEGGIDVLRNRIKQYASTVSLDDTAAHKVVILDEADYLTGATQVALRGFIEEFSSNCRFILTCNFKNRVIDALHSRCPPIEFVKGEFKKPAIMVKFLARLKMILNSEKIIYESSDLPPIINRWAPDWRRILGEIQKYSSNHNAQIDPGILSSDAALNDNEIFKILGSKSFKQLRQWVANHIDLESQVIFRHIFDLAEHNIDTNQMNSSTAMAKIIHTISQYQYWDAFVADKEINTLACLVELMMNVSWKTN